MTLAAPSTDCDERETTPEFDHFRKQSVLDQV